MNKFLFMLAFIFATCIYELKTQRQEQDYYSVLGITRNATEKDIKKAFKKLSAKYHPDKFQNQKQKEKAKEKFMVIANAYDVLNNAETKKIYDQHGAQGVRQNKAGNGNTFQGNPFGGHQFNGGDFFNSFFEGGSGFHFDFGNGGGHRQQRQQRQQHADLYNNSDVIKLQEDNYGKFEKRREVMYVVFYNPDEQRCREQEDTIKELANKNYDYFGVAVVNCRDNEQICQKFEVDETPKIFLYPQNTNANKINYTGRVQQDAMKVKAFGLIENFVEVLNENNINEFLVKQSDNKISVVLFTEKKGIHPLFKIISKMHKPSIKIGVIKNSGLPFSKTMIQKLKIKKYPAVVAIRDTTSFEVQEYTGEFKRQILSSWISQTVKKIKQQKQERGSILELTQIQQKYNLSCTEKDSRICVILFINNGSNYSKIENDFREAIQEIESPSKLKFAILDVNKYPTYYDSIKREIDEMNLAMIVIKGKGQKYKYMEKVQEALIFKKQVERMKIKAAIKQQIQDVLSGSVRYKKFRKFPTLKSEKQSSQTHDL